MTLRYAITDSARDAADLHARRQSLLASAAQWAYDGIDYVQLRERDLDAGALLQLAREILQSFHRSASDRRPRLLINARADVAVAAGADGVHLTGRHGELTPAQVRGLFAARGLPQPIISVACHSLADVQQAKAQQADLLLFSPIFEKRVMTADEPAGRVVAAGLGLEALRQACAVAAPTPVLALGGVTADNLAACVEAGAAGVAAIRLFAAARDPRTATSEAARE